MPAGQTTKDKWTSGPAYDAWMGRWSQLLADDFLDWLSVPPGARWLDVCCGTGVLSQTIAKRCSPASVHGVDAAPTQIAFAREHRAHANVTFDVADAMALPFEEHRFDVAVSGLGLNFIPTPERALGEMRRVTRPGGTIAAYFWDYQQGARFVREFWDAALQFDPEALAFDQGRRFAFCTPEGLRRFFETANLEQVAVRALDIETRFSGFDDYWEPFLTGQGSAPHYLASRSEQVRDAIRERLRASLPANADGAIVLPARAWAVRAQCP
jgi:SAM-dependent methyltransferase